MSNDGVLRRLVDDANFNFEHGRYEASLALLCIAIDASAKKVFPKKQLSLEFPEIMSQGCESCKKLIHPKMKDGERFSRFLGVRLRQLFNVDANCIDFTGMKFSEQFVGADGVERDIYKLIRCCLLHEGDLDDKFKYIISDVSLSEPIHVKFQDGSVKFVGNIIDMLTRVVVGSVSNGIEFGVPHYKLQAKNGFDNISCLNVVAEKHGFSSSKIVLFELVIESIGPAINDMDNESLASAFNESASSMGALASGLWHACPEEPLCLKSTGITTAGVQVIREILELVDIKDVAY